MCQDIVELKGNKSPVDIVGFSLREVCKFCREGEPCCAVLTAHSAHDLGEVHLRWCSLALGTEGCRGLDSRLRHPAPPALSSAQRHCKTQFGIWTALTASSVLTE